MNKRLGFLSVCVLLAAMDLSIANASLPTLARVFGVDFSTVRWVVLVNLLVVTSVIAGVGRLGDLIGPRRLLRIGVGVFTGASMISALAPGLEILLFARAVQGFGAAVMASMSLALATRYTPRESTARTMGLLGTMSAVGTALGPTLGGIAAGEIGWRSIFFVAVPAGLALLLVVDHILPSDEPRHHLTPFDFGGMALMTVTLSLYALGMTRAKQSVDSGTLALFVLAVGGAVGFVRHLLRSQNPLLDIKALCRLKVGHSLASSFLVATVMMATLVVGPFYLTQGLGLGQVQVGMALAVGPLVVILTGVPAGWLAERIGPGRSATIGQVVMTVGLLLAAAAPVPKGLIGYLLPIGLLTAGYAIFQAGNNTQVMFDVQPENRGLLSGLLGLSRSLGMISGSSAMGSIFAITAGLSPGIVASPSAVHQGMRMTFAIAALLIGVAIAISRMPRIPCPQWRAMERVIS